MAWISPSPTSWWVELCEERAAIERAAAEGVPLTRSVRDPRTGRSYEARRRGISNGSIRKALDAAERVLRDAHKRGALIGEVPALKPAAPKADRPRPVLPGGRTDRRGVACS